jgi:hypothetical protein
MTRTESGGTRRALWWRRIALARSAFRQWAVRARGDIPAPSRRTILLAFVYGTVALPGILSSVMVATLHYGAARSASRGPELNFPALRSAGTIRVAEAWDIRRWAYRNSGRPATAWETLGPARGCIQVAPRDLVWLELNAMAIGHPEMLSKLNSGAVFRLSTAPVSGSMGEELAARISQFTGLRELDLRYLTPAPGAWEWASAFPRLESVWLRPPENALARDKMVAWCAGGGLLLTDGVGQDGALYFQRSGTSLTSDYGRGKMMPTSVVSKHEGGMRDGEAEEEGSR